MIVEKFASLPPWLDIEGVNFELQLIVNGRPDDVRLGYSLQYAHENSPHYENVSKYGCWENPFSDGDSQGFLWLAENIETDEDLINAVERCTVFLKKNNLYYLID